ncbi:MAG: hypothetical protein E7580_05975 [Ruminococcaceae bacterium]|nr:hypothetical protein [Oscillospiraceae bacterium]
MSSVRTVWISKRKTYSEVKEDLERRKLKLMDSLISAEGMSETDLECKTRICHTEKADGKEYYKCSIAYYYLSDYKNATIEKLQENLTNAKEELEELEEEIEEIEDLDGDELGDFDFESQEEYEERLDELDEEIYFLQQDIEMIEKYLNEKKD